MRISDWSSDVCSSDLCAINRFEHAFVGVPPALRREGGHAEEDTHQLAPLAQLVVDVTPFLALLAQLRQEARRLGVRKARGAHELEARLVRRCQRIGELDAQICRDRTWRSEEHTSELQSLMRSSYAVFCLKK